MTCLRALLGAVVLIAWVPLPVFASNPSETVLETDTEPSEGPPDQANGQILSLERGKRAPWSGMLIEQKDLVKWRLEIDNLQFRLDRTVGFEEEKCDAKTSYLDLSLKLERDRVTEHDSMWRERADSLANDVVEEKKRTAKASEKGFFDEPMVWFVSGMIVTGLIVGLGVYAAQ